MKSKTRKRRKPINNIFYILCVVILLFFVIKNTFSRFQSDVDVVAKLDAAFYIVDERYQNMNLKLDSIVPRSDPYVYNFVIANTDGENRAEVNLEYELKIVTTTNLPLTYNLYLNGNTSESIITNQVIEPDEYGTYFLTLETPKVECPFTNDVVNNYRLEVYFPSQYKDIQYQDIIEGIEIQVNSRQIVNQT